MQAAPSAVSWRRRFLLPAGCFLAEAYFYSHACVFCVLGLRPNLCANMCPLAERALGAENKSSARSRDVFPIPLVVAEKPAEGCCRETGRETVLPSAGECVNACASHPQFFLVAMEPSTHYIARTVLQFQMFGPLALLLARASLLFADASSNHIGRCNPCWVAVPGGSGSPAAPYRRGLRPGRHARSFL